ncbi:hypothetical protein [Borrelia miyamotoi]|uniref:Uncharacterized protein n=1 Tax=Borrelia miyamotoi TaxID=47466 RepID=A0AAQ3AHL5_9SPIR|nr:hypothetical protein [Borrelia miyamotoi]AOW96104.1 hypothetical protein AXH25_05340 [Borrelia miyamotoi]AOW96146.1 hypothetical protein AXH25_05575 [Borrelia miyamotoi]QTL84182.1 hypothetical protein bmLB2001_000942 [Borrelia miyamotoi]QTL84259.1 hypothetical protein bmLB2001_000985 [Borrelia miyamotoi]QTL84332.1 hypothetical protein bmLB2001_000859 [Borrelia miyamotoi]
MDIELEIGWFDLRANVALMHELGSDKMPTRSHLHKVASSSAFKEYINTPYMHGEFNKGIEVGMRSFGELFIHFYKDYVLAGQITPKLSTKTINAKRAKESAHPTTPLIDTGLMLDSIQARTHT